MAIVDRHSFANGLGELKDLSVSRGYAEIAVLGRAQEHRLD